MQTELPNDHNQYTKMLANQNCVEEKKDTNNKAGVSNVPINPLAPEFSFKF